jgi:hypothetical protein
MDRGADLAQSPNKPTVIRNTPKHRILKGNKSGAKIAHGDYILIVNPDTRFVGKISIFTILPRPLTTRRGRPKTLEQRWTINHLVSSFQI